jgi:hypothetical protein
MTEFMQSWNPFPFGGSLLRKAPPQKFLKILLASFSKICTVILVIGLWVSVSE